MTTLIELSNGTGRIVDQSVSDILSYLTKPDTIAIQVTVKGVQHTIMSHQIVEFYEYEYTPIEWKVAP